MTMPVPSNTPTSPGDELLTSGSPYWNSLNNRPSLTELFTVNCWRSRELPDSGEPPTSVVVNSMLNPSESYTTSSVSSSPSPSPSLRVSSTIGSVSSETSCPARNQYWSWWIWSMPSTNQLNTP